MEFTRNNLISLKRYLIRNDMMNKSKCILYVILFLLIGMVSCRKQTSEQTLENLSDDIRDDSTNAMLYHKRGMLFFAMGRLEEAEVDQNRAIKLDSSCAEAIKSRGLISFKKKNYRMAISDFTKAIELGDSQAYGLRGLAYFYSRQYTLALSDCERMKASGVKETVLMSECHTLIGQYSKAIDDIKNGMDGSVKDNIFFPQISALLAADGKHDESISRLSERLLNDTSRYDAPLYEYRGILYYKLRKYDKALNDFKKAIEKQNSKTGLSFFYIGMILAENNKTSEAIIMFDSAAIRNFGFYDLISRNKRLKTKNRLSLTLMCDSLQNIRSPKYSDKSLKALLLKDTAGVNDFELLNERMAAIFTDEDLQKEYRKCYQLLLEMMEQ